jgi:tryptophan synthase alpha chain
MYTVSVTGTTGERETLADTFAATIERARPHTDVPLALGFGIATPQHAAQAADAGADGVIVGSRLVRAAAEGEDVRALVDGFAGALR